jgi:ubiquinone/menaquinone biosynthesis C-methylase UbiE
MLRRLQAKFLMGAYRQHAQPGGKLRTVLELGCGPANHAIQLARRGVQAWALDANPAMLQYAAQKAAAAGVSGVSGLTTVQGDMADYSIKVCQYSTAHRERSEGSREGQV